MTIRPELVTKATFKSKVSGYVRRVEHGDTICITDQGRIAVDLVSHMGEDDRRLAELRGLVLKFDRPTDPADTEEKVQS